MGKRSNLLSENSVFATPFITSFSSVIGPFLFSSYLGLRFIWGLFDDQAFVFIMLFLLSRVCRKPNCTHIRKKTNPWVMLLFTREAGTLHLELRSREASSHSERCQRNWPEAQASIENGHYSPPTDSQVLLTSRDSAQCLRNIIWLNSPESSAKNLLSSPTLQGAVASGFIGKVS